VGEPLTKIGSVNICGDRVEDEVWPKDESVPRRTASTAEKKMALMLNRAALIA